ncbi:MAG TPA: response regulator [Myxococcota bacterium]|nr:response regulator [Myxococcota bacterium]
MPRILLVDDVRLFRKLASIILSGRGYEIEEAVTGEEAMKKFRADPPDIALVDLALPGMSGFDVCAQIKQDPAYADIPVIIVATSGRDEDIRKAVEAGCDDYITKPLDDTTLISKVEALLGKTDRRRFPRIPTTLQISFEDFRGIFFEFTRDISRTGVFIEMANPLPVGSRLRLSFSLPSPFSHPVMAYARVTRSVPPDAGHAGGVGANFIFLDENSERLIDALASAESDFEDASGVFSRVSFQTDNTPIGEVDDEPNQLRLLIRDQETLRSSHKELQEEYMRLSARFTLLDSLYAAADPQKALAAAMDGLGDLVGVESCAIFILAPDNQRLLLAASRALPASVPTSLPPAGPLAQALSEKVLQVPSQPWVADGSGWSVMAAVPLLFDGAPRGVIAIHGLYRQKAALTTYDHRMLELLGQSLGPALFNATIMKNDSLQWDADRILRAIGSRLLSQ